MKIYNDELEYCPICKKVVLHVGHDCPVDDLDEDNYSDRLTYGFKLLDMED